MPANPEAFQRLRSLAHACEVTDGDIAGPMLRRLGQIHRRQQRRIFASQGAEGRHGKWASLSPEYQIAKRRLLGTVGKILVLSGDMRDRFISASRSEYIQRYVKPFAQFGAASEVAGYHFRGNSKMPRRDPVSKTEKQLVELRQGIIDWWTKERVPQILRGALRLGRA